MTYIYCEIYTKYHNRIFNILVWGPAGHVHHICESIPGNMVGSYTHYCQGIVSSFFYHSLRTIQNDGLKFSLPVEFWRGEFGGGYPLYFGAVLDFYISMALIAVLCIIIIIKAPFMVQKLVILLIGNTIICVLLYFRAKKYEAIKALISSVVHSSG